MENQLTMRDIVEYIQDVMLQRHNFFIDGEAIAVILEEEKLFYLSMGVMELDLSEMGESD